MSGPSGRYTDSFFNTSDDYGHLYGHSGQSSPYEPMLSSHPQHVDSMSSLSAPFSGSVFKTLMSATHDTLIRSGNAAYTSMHTQFIQARCELEAERNTVTRLQNVIDKLTASRTTPIPMASETGPRDGPIDTLIIPDAPEALEEDHYPDVPYWHDLVWAQHSDRQKDRGKTVSKLGFLTDQDGCPVSESRIKEFMSHAKQVWNELYRNRLDPSSWTKKTPTATTFYSHEMRVKYEEFCYCDGNWKAERFAIIKYPDWCRDVRERGRLIRARPSKRKASEGSHRKDDRKRKKAKAKLGTSPEVPVIVLDEDIPNGATLVPSPTTSTTPQATKPVLTPAPLHPPSWTDMSSTGVAPTPDITPTIPPTKTTSTTPDATSPVLTGSTPLRPPSQSSLLSAGMAPAAPAAITPPTPIAPPASPVTTTSTTPDAASPAQTPPSQSESPSTGDAPTPDNNPPSIPPIKTASTTAHSDIPSLGTLDVSASPASPLFNTPTPLDVSNAPMPPSNLVPAGQVNNTTSQSSAIVSNAGQQSGRRRVNPLAGVSIPKPLFQVPADSPQAPVAKGLKSGKAMVASPSLLTPRNLFACDYLKDHTLSKSEFKTVWDNIDSETKKKYEALSKQKKLAAHVTSPAMPPVSNNDNTAS